MRLGGPLFGDVSTPETWVAVAKEAGYRAVYCPLKSSATDVEIAAYTEAAKAADLVIAEVGAWSNPLSPDEAERKKALAYCQDQLELAERIGANCCVNISGSRGTPWDGPHPNNLTLETFEQVVETTRTIIDAVKPKHTVFALETMPWMYPDSPDSYLALIRAIDRDGFGVHLDPVNMISSPQRYFANTDFLRECFAKLGRYIRSIHAKDILISTQMVTHIDEVRPGLGTLDYRVFLREAARLGPDTPVMLEHLPNEEEYRLAAAYVRSMV